MSANEKPILPGIKSPADVKALKADQLSQLAREIRDLIIEVTAVNGGHIGPNLGVVELTIMLHRVFNNPEDPFVFDVAHQGYVHKLLTGRQGEAFGKLRQTGGLSGFLSRAESEYDSYGAGHAGTALSAALGMAAARDLDGGENNVVAVIGDATLTCGIALEALNNIVQSTRKMIVVLNDNEWSIAKNVGAISKYLGELITNPTYNRLHNDLESFLKRMPGGDSIIQLGGKMKKEAKDFFVPSSLFEKLGLRYLGPIDGHDFELLNKYLAFAKNSPESVILHVITQKGHGYEIAIKQPERFHGASPFDPDTGKSLPAKSDTPPNYQNVFGKHLTRLAKRDKDILAITAAMPAGTGLTTFQQELPDQFFDVGIAEEHAVLFAAGLATQGKKPVVAIYSTFLQRAYDQLIHDVALQKLPMVLALDRAGLVGADGATHAGAYDIAYLRCIPQVSVACPADEAETRQLLSTAFAQDHPVAVRYPRGAGVGTEVSTSLDALPFGKGEIRRQGRGIAILAFGTLLYPALAAAENLDASVANMRWVKPMDMDLLRELASAHAALVTLEEGCVMGGAGSAVMEALQAEGIAMPVLQLGLPDEFIEHGDPAKLLANVGLDAAGIERAIRQRFPDLLGGSGGLKVAA